MWPCCTKRPVFPEFDREGQAAAAQFCSYAALLKALIASAASGGNAAAVKNTVTLLMPHAGGRTPSRTCRPGKEQCLRQVPVFTNARSAAWDFPIERSVRCQQGFFAGQ